MDLFDQLNEYDRQLAAWLRKLDASGPLTSDQQTQRDDVASERGDLSNDINTLIATELDGEAAALQDDAKAVQGLAGDLSKLKGTIDEAQRVLTTVGTVAQIVAKLLGPVAAFV